MLNQRVAAAPLEVRAGAAVWGDGRPAHRSGARTRARRAPSGALAGMLGARPDEVRVITPDVGGAFGAKFGADPEHASSRWLARQLGRPVRWVETRSENMLGDDARPRAGADRDHRRRPRRHGSRPTGCDVAAGLRRLPEVRRAAAVADRC